MILAALLLLQSDVTLAKIDRMAKARDVAGLTALLTPQPKGLNPLRVLRSNGAYGVGTYGWSAEALSSPDGSQQYFVLTTRMTSEDVGEIVLRKEGARLRYIPEQDAMGIAIRRHDIDLKFLPSEKRAVLVDRMSFSSAPGAKGPFLFRMSPNYKVSSITAGDKPVPYRQAGGVVLVARPQGSATYRIAYSAVVDQPQYAGSIGPREATLTNDYWYPMIARQPAPYDLTVRTPPTWTAVGQGELVSTQQTASERVTRFRMDLPVVYYSVSAAPFRTESSEIGGKRYTTWSMRMSPEAMRMQNELFAPILEFYERHFGPYPFSGFGALDSEVYGGGALEAYSYATYGTGMLPSDEAHEPAHTWWGGVLNNTYLESFWNESFAVFSDGLYRRNVPIGNVEERRLAFIEDGAGVPSYREAPLVASGAFIGGAASGLGYGKGAKVLQMLEQILGTDATIATMREWIRVDKGKAVTWQDYERVVLRMHPNANLKGFFDDWLRTPGYAELEVSDVSFADGTLSMNVRFKGPRYRMPLDVMLQYPDGTRTFSTVRLEAAEVVRIVGLRRKPALVSIDPWRRALRAIHANERPVELEGVLSEMQRYTDPATPEYLRGVRTARLSQVPSDLRGVFLVGHPDTTPAMRPLLEKVGFEVRGSRLTYRGTTVDLNEGGAMAVVDLPGGGRAAVGLGRTLLRPNVGRARLAVFDKYGRFLRGVTEPKTAGNLVFRLE